MKKIVALVLSLVMVLGLATTAFADVTTTTLKGTDGYEIYAVNATTPLTTKTNITKTVTGNAIAADGTVTYTATLYNDGNYSFVEVDSSCANYKLVQGNAVVAYLYNTTAVSTTVVADKAVAKFAGATQACGEYAKDVVVIKGVAYDAAGTDFAVLNGKFVTYNKNAVVTAKDHTYKSVAFDSATAKVTALQCADCKANFTVLDDSAVKTMVPTAYKQVTTADTTPVTVYIALAAVQAPATNGDKVESAETFDAGIAMYVGMSVMAAAGSAVVLKKKD